MTKKNIKGTSALRACPQALVYLLILVTVLSSLSTVYAQSYEDIVQYQGFHNYKALYTNIDFTDIETHWARNSINRMSALSIIRGLGNNRFGPNDSLSREEAISLIVRLMGLESEAQLRGQALIDNRDTGGIKILGTGDYWADGYINVAVNIGIVSADEKRTIEALTENQRTALEEGLESRMLSYESNEAYSLAQQNNIRNQLQTKLTKTYTWKRPASREQVAVWVARAVGLSPITGQSQQMIYNLNDWTTIDTIKLPLIEAVLQKGIMKGNDNRSFLPKDSLKRAEMATIIDNIHLEALENQGYVIKTGIVERIDTLTESIDGTTNRKKVFISKNDDSTISALVFQESDKETHDRGFVAIKNGEIVLPSEIYENEYIRYYINPENNVILVEALPNDKSEIEGFLQFIDIEQKLITIKDYYDRLYSFKIAEGANIRVNDLSTTLDQLLYDQELVLKVSNGNVVDIKGYLSIDNPEYIHPGEKVVIGKVLYFNKIDGKVTLIEDGKQEEYIIDSFTPVVKNNANVGINSIREGDILRLEFDDYKGKMPIKAYIANPDRQIANLYKANIVNYNPSRNEVILQSLAYYDNTQWKSSPQDIKLTLSGDSTIYINGRAITKELLSNYLGREAYIATAHSFGKEEAIKLVFKAGVEKKYSDSIQDIAFGDGKIKVDYSEMYYDDSTIIIKDGKLIHPYNLKEDDSVFVISHGSGTQTASLISVEGIEATGLVVYRGRIDDISQYGFQLYNINIIEGTEQDTTRRKTFDISEDTKIIDTRYDEVKEVTVEEFTNSRFLRDRYRWDEENYIREYAYAIGDGDMVFAIDIIDRDKEGQVISAANIKTIDRQEEMITIKDIRDWNAFREVWNVNRSEVNLDVKEALFIKNGRPVTLNEIRNNDNLYIIRRNDFGYIIICR
ncbi:MAG: S-layer homology domain-containing protein [Tissierellales bacterium]